MRLRASSQSRRAGRRSKCRAHNSRESCRPHSPLSGQRKTPPGGPGGVLAWRVWIGDLGRQVTLQIIVAGFAPDIFLEQQSRRLLYQFASRRIPLWFVVGCGRPRSRAPGPSLHKRDFMLRLMQTPLGSPYQAAGVGLQRTFRSGPPIHSK